MLMGQLALVVAAAFAGTAIYVLFCEHPARRQLDDRAALVQWKPSYKHGAIMQASLSVIGTLLGVAAWWRDGGALWLSSAIALILPWPFTLIVIKPTNDALLATDFKAAGPRSRAMLETWGRLHVVRTALGVLALILFFAASLPTFR